MLQTKVIHKKTRFPWFMMVLVFILLLFGAWRFVVSQQQPVDINDTTFIAVNIPSDAGARQIAEILRSQDLIRNEKVFLNYLSRNGLDSQLKAGNYKFTRSQTMEQIAKMIVEGKVDYLTFTIPEGYTLKEMGALLEKHGLLSEDEWEQALIKPYEFDFLQDIPAGKTNRLEGFLFPDTYNITADDNGERIINMMLSRFAEVWEDKLAARAKEKGWSALEVVTVASLIEREAAVPEERKTISGVIANRLEIGMPLQIDATILYALNEHKELISNVDLKVDSPYNTYIHNGLPPGPIAAPGVDSLQAALDPEDNPYFYYVSRGDGTHEFTRTFTEHLQAISKYNQ